MDKLSSIPRTRHVLYTESCVELTWPPKPLHDLLEPEQARPWFGLCPLRLQRALLERPATKIRQNKISSGDVKNDLPSLRGW